MSERFKVVEYRPDALERVIVEIPSRHPKIPPERLRAKLHLAYFREYLGILGAQTILVEYDYVDRDFLEDFAAYYVRCFQSYERKCTRLHFFNLPFSEGAFGNLLSAVRSELSEKALRDHYLGFIVIKPLPETIIGRTCFKPYSDDGGRRSFPTSRKYKVNLFGIELSVDSLAFQEQDSVAAACASSALWSVFQGTGELFHHAIPSPVEITRAATEHAPVLSRVFPNKDGLTGEQMAHAIANVGLEPLLAGFSNATTLKAVMYAYLKAKIPLAFVIRIVDHSSDGVAIRDLHAVAVTGYGLDVSPRPDETGGTLRLRSSRMDRIYSHDDQVGPFARMLFRSSPSSIRDENGFPDFCFSTSWESILDPPGEVIAVPNLLLVPLYHKIRIPFEVVHDLVFRFQRFIDLLRGRNVLPTSFPTSPEWDIHLTTVNELKTSLLEQGGMLPENRLEILTEEMPRFIWRATLCDGDKESLDLLFDATDIEQGGFFIRAIERDPALSASLRSVAKVPGIVRLFETEPEWCILGWFNRQPVAP